ncbi:MAG: hypothetical protein HOO95_05540 [Gallionella sp.]|nr:hypothetical protein [Gallionella sp.]
MNNFFAIPLFCSITLLFASINSSSAEPAAAVKVGVVAEHIGSKIMYSYHVINNSSQTISAIAIGRGDGEVNELTERPSGLSAKGIPQSSASSPTAWHVNMVMPPDSPTHSITWEATNSAARLATEQTLNNMSVTVNKGDILYLTGHALITFADGNPTKIIVPIERLDTSPPKLSVALIPNSLTPAHDKFVAINASFSIKSDNHDHFPTIKLESITANQPLGADDIRDASFGLDDRYFKLRAEQQGQAERVYKISYSATDASGNKTMAEAAVTVGHKP